MEAEPFPTSSLCHLSHLMAPMGECSVTESRPTRCDPMMIACQAPLSMGFSRQRYWSGLPCLPPGHLPDPGIKPTSLKSPALAGGFFTTSTTWEALGFMVPFYFDYLASPDFCFSAEFTGASYTCLLQIGISWGSRLYFLFPLILC